MNWLKEERHHSEGTCARRFSTLKNIGAKLVEWNIIQVNPLQKLKISRLHREKEIKYWQTAEEISKIIEGTSGVWHTINYIGFFIGARISEILNIKWADVDFVNGKIRIQPSGTFRTKSRKFRTIKMPQYLEKYLLELKKERNKSHKIKTTKIAVYSDGSSPTMETASSYLKSFIKSKDLRAIIRIV